MSCEPVVISSFVVDLGPIFVRRFETVVGMMKQGGDDGEPGRVPSIDELWDIAEKKFPGKMMALYDELFEDLESFGERLSLLKEMTLGDQRLNEISDQLAEATLNNYTPHFNSMFLAHFPTSKRKTHGQFGRLGDKYMRLGEIDGKRKEEGYNADLHDVENSFTSIKSVQLALLFDHLLGHSVPVLPTSNVLFDGANSEQSYMRPLFDPVKVIINGLFAFTKKFDLTVNADFEVKLPEGTGKADFAVTVDTLYKGNKKATTECVSVVEFKRPNAGFWIPWGPLTGQKWTEDEEAAFFELKKLKLKFDDNLSKGKEKLPSLFRKEEEKLPRSLQNERQSSRKKKSLWGSMKRVLDRIGSRKGKEKMPSSLRKRKVILTERLQDETDELLSSWKKDPLWDAAEEALARIGSNRVRVEYRTIEKKSVQDSDRQTGSTSAQGSKRFKSDRLTPFYYIETPDGEGEDITELLKSAKFKTSFDSCHNGLAQGIAYVVLNKCNRVVTADALTIIGGSLNRLEKSKFPKYNPANSADALDAHFYSTYMMQTHDRDSLVHLVNYFAEGVMLRSNLRRLGYQLVSFSDPEGHKNDPITAATKLEAKMLRHKVQFSPENPGVQFPAWKESLAALNEGARQAVGVALADFEVTFPELKPKMDCITSDSFDVVKWYRRDMYEGFESDEPLTPGRSNSVARVQRHDDKRGTHFVLKEYYPDQDSVARMKRELEAYYRVSKLPGYERTRHVAELVSFGSLDLDEVPRLFLMLEYVEDSRSYSDLDTSMADQPDISAEVDKVNRLLKSVGVYHNDLEHRNYRLQSDSDGGWHIKVFDFDHATFISP